MGNIHMVDPTQDFTADPVIGDENKDDNNSNISPGNIEIKEEESVQPPAKKTKPAKRFSLGQNPLMTLNEVKPGLSWECSETGHSPATKKFCMKVLIDGEKFEGSGASKKLAKQAAARTVLSKLYKIQFMLGQMEEAGSGEEMKVAGTDMVLSEFSEDQSIADNIGRLILQRYDEMMIGHSQISRRKVIAGIVMTLDLEMKKMVVISVSTGTKCISGEYMSQSGMCNSINLYLYC